MDSTSSCRSMRKRSLKPVVLRKNISAIAENLGILYARSIGSADGKKSTNFFFWNGRRILSHLYLCRWCGGALRWFWSGLLEDGGRGGCGWGLCSRIPVFRCSSRGWDNWWRGGVGFVFEELVSKGLLAIQCFLGVGGDEDVFFGGGDYFHSHVVLTRKEKGFSDFGSEE